MQESNHRILDHFKGRPDAEAVKSGTVSALRVLIIAPSLDMLGGQSRQAALMIERLRQEPSLALGFLPTNPKLPAPFNRLQDIKYIRTVITSLLYWGTLLARVWRYDVIHVFSASYYSYLLSAMPAVLAARIFARKSILNYRSGEAEDHLGNWRTAIPSIRQADLIVVPSGYLVDVFERFGLHARAVHDIVELDRFRFRERRKLRPVFLTSRLLEPLYNVGCVLCAFQIIQKRFPDAGLTIAGEGRQRSELETLARDLGLRNTVFVGRVPFEKMPDMYDSADIYLNATDLDNMPGSITECMASGLPVVTTNAGGIPYIVSHEETCLMVERNDHEAMAASAIRLLDNPDLALRIARAARESSRKFTWKNVKSEWLDVYQELARKGAKAHDVSKNDARITSEATGGHEPQLQTKKST